MNKLAFVEYWIYWRNSLNLLWEPFLRAKAALLIGSIIEKVDSIPDTSSYFPLLLNMFINGEEIEQTFSLIAIAAIGAKQPEALTKHVPTLVKQLIYIVAAATVPTAPFCLFHSKPFQSQIYESFLDFLMIPGFLDNPENVQRLVENNITLAIFQIAVSTHIYLPKKPSTLWRVIWVFLRITTEHPRGLQLWDANQISRCNVEPCILMKAALVSKDRAGAIRNLVDKIPQKERTAERFTQLLKELPK